MQRLIARTRSALDTSWAERRAMLGRDLAMLFGRTNPSPIVRAARPTPGTLAHGTRWLSVVEVVHETPDAVTLVFEPTLGAWTPGQFLTVHVDVGGERLRRAYSLCTRPSDPRGPAITIKRIPDGKVSGHLVATAQIGLRLEVRGPSGQFVLPARTGPRHVLLIGGGSGITPLVALAEEVLAQGDRVTLLFGNRSAGDIIFRARLAALATASDGRLQLRHVLEQAPEPASDVAVPVAPVAPVAIGRLDPLTLARELDLLGTLPDEVFSCGPAPMMAAVREALPAAGLDPRKLHEERFQSLGEHRAQILPTTAQSLRITVAGRTSEVLARPGATVLEAGLAAGLAMPFSCTMGGCGACRVKLSGDVVHDTPNGLTPDEAAAGYAFACIARPLGPCSVLVPTAAGHDGVAS